MTPTPYWQSDCGRFTVYHCKAEELIPHVKVDAVLTDPPYGIGAAASDFIGTKKRTNAKCAPRDYGHATWDDSAADVSCLNQDSPLIVWGGNFLNLPNTPSWLVWDKVMDGMDFSACELAWTNLGGGIRLFRHEWVGFRRGTEHGISRHHPTQKPVALMLWCLGFLGDAETIGDFYAGSFTTAVACVRAGKQFIGCDMVKEYCDIGVERIKRELAQPRLPGFEPVQAKQEALL